MPIASDKTTDKKKTTAAKLKTTSTKAKTTKISITLDKETMEQLLIHLDEIGSTKEGFALAAVLEKLSRDKISYMIDTMIR